VVWQRLGPERIHLESWRLAAVPRLRGRGSFEKPFAQTERDQDEGKHDGDEEVAFSRQEIHPFGLLPAPVYADARRSASGFCL
jgi:hypothetical protein